MTLHKINHLETSVFSFLILLLYEIQKKTHHFGRNGLTQLGGSIRNIIIMSSNSNI